MEIVVTARHTEVSGRFRRHLEEKLVKVGQLAPRALRLEVGVSHEVNKRQAHTCERIELTLLGKGPVVRAEACADDPYVALDLATTKLMERLRRSGDRRKVHHGRHPLASVRSPAALVGEPGVEQAKAAELLAPAPVRHPERSGSDSDDVATEYVMGESPVVIRDKVHVATPMALEDALVEMELVGHDFFLFHDSTTGCPSVVYRRRGWSYGVIRLADGPEEASRISEAVAAAATVAASSQTVPVG